MNKEWVVQPRTEDDLIAQLLVNRGVIDQSAFLNPDYHQLHDPFKLKNMPELVERLVLAIDNQESIGIFGDYDHDGTPAAALLSEGIAECGGTIGLVYIPTREEGYSLSQKVIDLMVEQGIQLLITVDCGITNKPEIDYAVSRGLNCMVIDHHVVQLDKYPDAAIVVNPKQDGDTYPFKEMCACGLAFKTVQALAEKTGKIPADQLKWYLDLVAISTICDMVPLVDENRTLVHYGLIVLQKTRRLGLQQLIKAASIDPKTISTYTVGFGIGPRLNAPGRMERASIAYELLVAKEKDAAAELAARLNELNAARQAELDNVLREAEAVVQSKKLHDKKVILVSGAGWNDGVVGLVAGRLMDKYHRPTIVLAEREDGLAKGSARSIDGFHLVDALQESEQYLVKYGGHAKAAGLTLLQEHLELLYDKLIEAADSKLDEVALRPRIMIDATLRSNELTLPTALSLARLEPYGLGNPRPIFALERMTVVDSRSIGQTGKHLKLKLLTDDNVALEAIAFGMADRQEEVTSGAIVDIVGMLDVNEWQQRQSVQFKVIDWRPSR